MRVSDALRILRCIPRLYVAGTQRSVLCVSSCPKRAGKPFCAQHFENGHEQTVALKANACSNHREEGNERERIRIPSFLLRHEVNGAQDCKPILYTSQKESRRIRIKSFTGCLHLRKACMLLTDSDECTLVYSMRQASNTNENSCYSMRYQ